MKKIFFLIFLMPVYGQKEVTIYVFKKDSHEEYLACHEEKSKFKFEQIEFSDHDHNNFQDKDNFWKKDFYCAETKAQDDFLSFTSKNLRNEGNLTAKRMYLFGSYPQKGENKNHFIEEFKKVKIFWNIKKEEKKSSLSKIDESQQKPKGNSIQRIEFKTLSVIHIQKENRHYHLTLKGEGIEPLNKAQENILKPLDYKCTMQDTHLASYTLSEKTTLEHAPFKVIR